MSWIQKLHETYERCVDALQFQNKPLMPVGHTEQQAWIETTTARLSTRARLGL
jgi:hypothetical protein